MYIEIIGAIAFHPSNFTASVLEVEFCQLTQILINHSVKETNNFVSIEMQDWQLVLTF